MANIKNLVPAGFIFPFLIIFIVEYGVIYFLKIVENSFSNQITVLEDRVKSKENEVSTIMIQSDSFFVFSQVVNVIEILKQKKSVSVIIEKFISLMPNFVGLKNITIDNQNQEININGEVNNLTDYVRFANYLNNNQYFKLKSITPPQISEADNKVSFSVTIKIQPKVY